MALSQYETRIARALADVLFSPSGTLPGPDEAGVVERVSAYLGSLPADVQAQMRALLIGFDVAYAESPVITAALGIGSLADRAPAPAAVTAEEAP